MKGKEQTLNPSAISYTTGMAQVDWAAMKDYNCALCALKLT
jgi:hypothetical protein